MEPFCSRVSVSVSNPQWFFSPSAYFEAMHEAVVTGSPVRRGRRGAGAEARRCIARARARTVLHRDVRHPCCGSRPSRHGLRDRRTWFAREDLLRHCSGPAHGHFSNCGFARRPVGYAWSLSSYHWGHSTIVLDVAVDRSYLTDVVATRDTTRNLRSLD